MHEFLGKVEGGGSVNYHCLQGRSERANGEGGFKGVLGVDSSVLLHPYPTLPGITGILMSAAGLPVCLTRPPKLVLHPPPVSKSEIKSIPGVSNTSRKTTKKQAKKGTLLVTF